MTTTRVGGFTLGGGYAWISPKYGLACDNLLSAQVVTVAGKIVTPARMSMRICAGRYAAAATSV